MYMFVFILPSVKWDTNLDKNASFIISKCNIVWAFKHSHAPNSFETIVKGALQAVCIGLPNAHSTFGNDRNYIQFTYTHQKSDELVLATLKTVKLSTLPFLTVTIHHLTDTQKKQDCYMCIYKAEHTILWASQNDWQFWVKTNTRDVLSMSLKCLNTSFILKCTKKNQSLL